MPVYPPHALEPAPPPLKKTNILGTPSAADMSPAPSRSLWRPVLPPVRLFARYSTCVRNIRRAVIAIYFTSPVAD